VDGSFNVYLDPRGFNVQQLNSGIAAIQVARVNGQTQVIDPAGSHAEIQQEHPPVERMADDLGAICQVFKESSNYFLSLPGVALAPGDQVTLRYQHQAYTAVLRVIELENGRCRIEPPVVNR
jgi:hypothetical protein